MKTSHILYVALSLAVANADELAAQTRIRVPQTAPKIQFDLAFKSAETIDFGRIVAVTAGKARDVYAADGQAQTITQLRDNGSIVKTFGSKGKGPGEFKDLSVLSWLADTLVAVDASAFRLTKFSASGKLLETMEWPQPPNAKSRYYTAYPTMALSQGNGILVRSKPIIFAKDTMGKPQASRPRMVYAMVGPNHSVRTYDASFDVVPPNGNFDCEAPNGVIAILHPFFPVPGPWRALSNNRLVAADPSSYVIRIIDLPTGKTIRTLEREYPVQQVDDATWQQATTEYREAEKEHGRLGCDLKAMRPKTQPVISSVIADEAGRIWIEAKRKDGYYLAAMKDDGTLLGEAKMPQRDLSVPFFIRGDRLYIVAKDEDDVQRVEGYRIRMPQTNVRK